MNASAGDTIAEVFLLDGQNVLQLTNFRRADTSFAELTPDGQRAIFAASADPFGRNPSGSCQIFSIDTLGTGLRQITHFSPPGNSVDGCNVNLLDASGCYILPTGGLDPVTGTLVFYSSCDPLGTNPYGDQLFSIHPDGTHLRQLTHARGEVTEADGTVSAENLGDFGYSAAFAAHP